MDVLASQKHYEKKPNSGLIGTNQSPGTAKWGGGGGGGGGRGCSSPTPQPNNSESNFFLKRKNDLPSTVMMNVISKEGNVG